MPDTFSHRHLLDIERLSLADIEAILSLAETYAAQNRKPDKKIDKWRGRTLVNLFFENSTRTRTSFEIAAKRLGMDVINVPVEHSSTKKGETLLDTVLTLDAMQIDALVIRHNEDGVPQFIAPHVRAHVLNAGDGKHEHPTQALLDALTIRRHKGTLSGLTIVYCGDYIRSRVAGSFVRLMGKFGARVRIVGPKEFITGNPTQKTLPNVDFFEDYKKALTGADVVMTQRIQIERINPDAIAFSPEDYQVQFADYHRLYGLTHEKLKVAKPDVIVMDPGPVIRGVAISSELADDPAISVIREQVEMGVAVRMAALDLLMGAG
jgi:aspartate carbamoyltransferase catalytic subunit